MKKFSIHAVRNVFAFVIALGLGYVAYTVNPISVTGPNAEAGTVDNISGWAWSKGTGANTYSITGTADAPASGVYTAGSNPGLGWISFNSTSDNATVPYGVNLTTTNKASGGIGSFSGQAWSGNNPDTSSNPTGVGWISFDRSITGSPLSAWGDPGASQTDTPLAYVNWSTGKVYGWARAISACKDNRWDGIKCTSYLYGDTAGGWDGWIKLSDPSWPDGVIISGNKFSGLAWGGEVMGWIDFAPKVNGVYVGVRLAGASCTEASVNSGGTWGTCVANKVCASGDAGTTFSNEPGIKTGLCSATDGGGETIATCNTAVLVCPTAAPSTGKKKFWQF